MLEGSKLRTKEGIALVDRTLLSQVHCGYSAVILSFTVVILSFTVVILSSRIPFM